MGGIGLILSKVMGKVLPKVLSKSFFKKMLKFGGSTVIGGLFGRGLVGRVIGGILGKVLGTGVFGGLLTGIAQMAKISGMSDKQLAPQLTQAITKNEIRYYEKRVREYVPPQKEIIQQPKEVYNPFTGGTSFDLTNSSVNNKTELSEDKDPELEDLNFKLDQAKLTLNQQEESSKTFEFSKSGFMTSMALVLAALQIIPELIGTSLSNIFGKDEEKEDTTESEESSEIDNEKEESDVKTKEEEESTVGQSMGQFIGSLLGIPFGFVGSAAGMFLGGKLGSYVDDYIDNKNSNNKDDNNNLKQDSINNSDIKLEQNSFINNNNLNNNDDLSVSYNNNSNTSISQKSSLTNRIIEKNDNNNNNNKELNDKDNSINELKNSNEELSTATTNNQPTENITVVQVPIKETVIIKNSSILDKYK